MTMGPLDFVGVCQPPDLICEYRARFDGRPQAVERACLREAFGAYIVIRPDSCEVQAFSACLRHFDALAVDLEMLGFSLVESLARVPRT